MFTPPTLFSLISLCGALQIGGGGFTNEQNWAGSEDSRFGNSTTAIGDIDQDGYADVLIGAPGYLDKASAVEIYSSRTGDLLHRIEGPRWADFGWAVANVGDVTGDGVDDFAVSDHSADSPIHYDTGKVTLFNGSSYSPIYEWYGTTHYAQFGHSIAAAGDVDGDGTPDIVIGAPGSILFSAVESRVEVYSGATGNLIHDWKRSRYDNRFGESVCSAGDWNGDGHPDILIGAPGISGGDGAVFLYSGADGSRLWDHYGFDRDSSFGEAVAAAGDLDFDGVGDFLVGAPYESPHGGSVGAAHVISGASGAAIYSWFGANQAGKFGAQVASGDVTGDGDMDLLVGGHLENPGGIPNAGVARLYSGMDGVLLHEWTGRTQPSFLGFALSLSGDLTADGAADVLIGAPKTKVDGQTEMGEVSLHSYAPYQFLSSHEISMSQGGQIQVSLDFPDTAAGLRYRVLASLSGTGPTTVGIPVPLTDDAILQRSLGATYPGAMSGNLFGRLDSNGQATATLRLSAGTWTGLVGKRAYLATIAISADGVPIYSSSAAKIRFHP